MQEIEVPIIQAAQILGCHVDSVRRGIRRGDYAGKHRKDPTGRLLVKVLVPDDYIMSSPPLPPAHAHSANGVSLAALRPEVSGHAAGQQSGLMAGQVSRQRRQVPGQRKRVSTRVSKLRKQRTGRVSGQASTRHNEAPAGYVDRAMFNEVLRQRDRLEREVDTMHGELLESLEANREMRQLMLAREIGQRQVIELAPAGEPATPATEPEVIEVEPKKPSKPPGLWGRITRTYRRLDER